MGHDALSDLAPCDGELLAKKKLADKYCDEKYKHHGGNYFLCRGFGTWFLWFLVISIVAWIIIFSLQPNWIMKLNPATGQFQLDGGKLLLYSVIIGLIITLLLWLLSSCWGGGSWY